MSMHTAELGDVYRDPQGKLWMVRWICHEPTVGVVELSHEPLDEHETKSGGVSGLMWHGFTKLEAKDAA